MIVLDTNVVSELMRRSPAAPVVRWAQAQPPAQVYTTSVTLAEVRYGIARLPSGRRKQELLVAAGRAFETFAERVLAFDAAAAVLYADVAAARARLGVPISGFDAQIASICLRHRAVLATRNTGDFERLGLDLLDPWSDAGS